MKSRRELINVLCRVCGQEDRNAIYIFGESGKKQNILIKLHSCLPIIVSENDGMPNQICLSCLTKLDASWDLFNLCKQSLISIEKKLNLASRLHENNALQITSYNCIEEKISSLSVTRPISYGESAVICLVPESLPRTPQPVLAKEVVSEGPVLTPAVAPENLIGVQPLLVNQAPGMTYTQPVPTQPMTAPVPVTEEVYPQSLIQVPTNPNSKPVVYQSGQRPMTLPRNKIPVPKPMAPPPTNSTPLQAGPSKTRRKGIDTINGPPSKRGAQMCKFCNKSFPDDIIDHHVSLHLRQSFMTCLECNKNFRSELAMSRHRCGANESIDLDPEDKDDLICL